MKRNSLTLIGFIFLTSLQSMAIAAEPPPITECIADTADLCVDLQFYEEPNNRDESEFDVQINTPDGGEVKNIVIKLRMVMGSHEHGAAPVSTLMTGRNTYHVNNAWFSMPSENEDKWFVQISFDFNNKKYQVRLPVFVNKKE